LTVVLLLFAYSKLEEAKFCLFHFLTLVGHF